MTAASSPLALRSSHVAAMRSGAWSMGALIVATLAMGCGGDIGGSRIDSMRAPAMDGGRTQPAGGRGGTAASPSPMAPPSSGRAGASAGGRTGAGRGAPMPMPQAGRRAPQPVAGCAADGSPSGGRSGVACSPSEAPSSPCSGPVGPVPDLLREKLDLDSFYEKHLDADGLPILASSAPDDRALQRACELVREMVSEREDARTALIKSGARFVIIGRDEGTADIPEYGYIGRPQADRDEINRRARGLGGRTSSCGEENILCLPGDRYFDESICIHEFSHTISIYGLYAADRSFEQRLRGAYEDARDRGILEDTYRLENEQEYWAEGVQDWYGSNAEADPPNGIHNDVDSRVELLDYDPTLHALVDELLPSELSFPDCHPTSR